MYLYIHTHIHTYIHIHTYRRTEQRPLSRHCAYICIYIYTHTYIHTYTYIHTGVPNSGLSLDICGVCGGNGASCRGCDNVPFSGKKFDQCGVCGGDNTVCAGCDGVPHSNKKLDSCGICDGKDTHCTDPYMVSATTECTAKRMYVQWQAPSDHPVIRLRIHSAFPCLVPWERVIEGEVPGSRPQVCLVRIYVLSL